MMKSKHTRIIQSCLLVFSSVNNSCWQVTSVAICLFITHACGGSTRFCPGVKWRLLWQENDIGQQMLWNHRPSYCYAFFWGIWKWIFLFLKCKGFLKAQDTHITKTIQPLLILGNLGKTIDASKFELSLSLVFYLLRSIKMLHWWFMPY